MKSLRLMLAVLVLTAMGAVAFAATVPLFTGVLGSNPIQGVPQTVPDFNALINNINTGITPQSMATPTNFRNVLDNGAMLVAQRGTAATAGGTTTTCVYVADRWCVQTNVSSGAGSGQVATATPTPPPGFTNEMKLYRNSGVLTQPIIAWQEVQTIDVTALQGQLVTFSANAQALANLSSDNGNLATLYVVYGTGTDQGLQTPSTTPLVTPAFTGITTLSATSISLSGSAWNRYSVTVAVPLTATELAVGVGFTPTAAAVAGTTDGLAFTGVQLEVGAAGSSFEFRPYSIELAKAQRFFVSQTEPATGIPVAMGVLTSTTSCALTYPLPYPMWKAPVTAGVTFTGNALSTSTFRIQDSTTSTLASTFLVFGNGATSTQLGLTATLTTASTAGWGCQLQGAGGGAIINVSTDF